MNKFQQRYSELKKLKEDREKGIYSGIPLWESFPRLGNIIPTINKGQVIINAAASGVGKSMVSRYKDIVAAWNFVRKNPDCGIKLQFVVFLLEDDENRFIDYLTTTLIGLVHNVHVSPTYLQSKKEIISEEILDLVASVEKYVEEILSLCHIETNVFNSYGIYKTCRQLSEDWGEHYYTYSEEEGKEFINKVQHSQLKELSSFDKKKDKKELASEGVNLKEYQNYWKYAHYKPKDPQQHTIVVIDNINCLHPDKYELTLKNAIDTLSYNYMRMGVAKQWGWTVIMVQQNVGGAEEQEFDFKGNNVIQKLTPSLDKLADSKASQRAAHLVYGLFAPHRYGISSYLNYNIKELGNNCRFLFVLKNNDGEADVIIPLWFYGQSGVFKELPMPNEITQSYLKEMRKGIIK
jgi:hypothetical protein|tara:strand:- start:9891 stop:11108 length:1218 start_codon:yes stop_codon:yes gene_type:complete